MAPDVAAPAAHPSDRTDPEVPRPAVIGGALAGAAVAVAGAILCAALAVLGWLSADGGSAPAAARVGLSMWALAHRTPVELAGVRLGLPPLGLTVLAVVALVAVGRWVARTSTVHRIRDAAAGTAGLVLSYAGCGVLLALISRSGAGGADLAGAAIGTGIVALVAAGGGVLYGSGVVARGWRRLPIELRAAALGGCGGLLALLGGAALLLAGTLIAEFDRVAGLARALQPGSLGGVLLMVISLVYVPNAVIFAMAFCVGPGFAVGVGTVVSPTGVHLGPLPALPLLGALPGATPGPWVMAVLAVPFVAGVFAGVLAVRAYPPGAHDLAAVRGAVAGVVAGIGAGLVTLLAGGPAGPGRLTEVGASAVEVGMMAMLAMGLGGTLAGTVATGWRMWRARRAATMGHKKAGNKKAGGAKTAANNQAAEKNAAGKGVDATNHGAADSGVGGKSGGTDDPAAKTETATGRLTGERTPETLPSERTTGESTNGSSSDGPAEPSSATTE